MSTVKNVEKAGRQVWLAGLGACLLGKEYAVKKLDEMFEGTNSLVNEVMTKGQEIEADLKSKVSAGFPVSSNFLQDEKIAELREKLGLSQESKQDKISRLVVKVDALTEIVATISVRAEEEKAAAKKSAATATPKKSTATRKPRATASKTAPASKAASTGKSVASDTAAKKPTATRTRTRKAATAKTTAAKTTTARATLAKTTTTETNSPKAAESAQSKTDKD